MSRLIWILGVVVLILGGLWLYNTYFHKDPLGSGLVISRDSDSDLAANSSTAKEPAKPVSPSSTPAPVEPANTTSAPAVLPPQPAPPAPAAKPSAAHPAADTLTPNPPNGAVYTGTGQYTWYRQGNITWRVDSASGASCIAFATLEEWRKRIVYTHGCGKT